MKIDQLTEQQPEVTTSSQPAAASGEAGLSAARRAYWILLALLLLSYCLSGITRIAPDEVGLVRRFGEWTRENDKVLVHQPGLLLAWPTPIDSVVRVPVKQERTLRVDLSGQSPLPSAEQTEDESEASEAQPAISPPVRYLLTGDEGLVRLQLEARYRIVAPDLWVTSSADPSELIAAVLSSSATNILNSWKIDDVLLRQRLSLTESGEPLHAEILVDATQKLRPLNLGIELTALELISVQPPEDVQEAFAAVQDARVDQETWRQEAEGDYEEVRLNAERMALVEVADAKGKLDSLLGKVADEFAVFQADLAAFQKSPELTKDRLRREAWESILRSSGRVITVPPNLEPGSFLLPLPEQEGQR
ncbi:MAG: SPFH domain-containing protein [Planctomycetaceae bacterium]